MKATIEIPDDLYRSVKARSALEGRPLRAVAIELFRKWVEAPAPSESGTEAGPGNPEATWLDIARRYLRPELSHDLESIRQAIADGWGAEAAEKISSS